MIKLVVLFIIGMAVGCSTYELQSCKKACKGNMLNFDNDSLSCSCQKRE